MDKTAEKSNGLTQENVNQGTRTSDASCWNEALPPQGLKAKTALGELVSISDYLSIRTNVFRSRGSLDWFIRQHKDALREHAALYCIAKRMLIHAERFDAFVLAQGEQGWSNR